MKRLLPNIYLYIFITRAGYIQPAITTAKTGSEADEKVLKLIRLMNEEFANTHFYRCAFRIRDFLNHLKHQAVFFIKPMQPSVERGENLMQTFVAKEVRKPGQPHFVTDYSVKLKKEYLSKDEMSNLKKEYDNYYNSDK